MPEITVNEALIRDVVRECSYVPRLRTASPDIAPTPRKIDVSAQTIVDKAWRNGRGLTYDQTFRALRGLVKKGLLIRVRRGWYREA